MVAPQSATVVALPLAAVSILVPPDNAALLGVKFTFAGLSTLAVPAGAVIAYNRSRPSQGGSSSLGNRLEIPQLAVRRERLQDKSGVTVYDVRLMTVRF